MNFGLLLSRIQKAGYGSANAKKHVNSTSRDEQHTPEIGNFQYEFHNQFLS